MCGLSPGRGARLATRDEGVNSAFVTEEQRSQPGCLARELVRESLLQDTRGADARRSTHDGTRVVKLSEVDCGPSDRRACHADWVVVCPRPRSYTLKGRQGQSVNGEDAPEPTDGAWAAAP